MHNLTVVALAHVHQEAEHQKAEEHHSNGVGHDTTLEDDLVSSSPVHENGHSNGVHHHNGHEDEGEEVSISAVSGLCSA